MRIVVLVEVPGGKTRLEREFPDISTTSYDQPPNIEVDRHYREAAVVIHGMADALASTHPEPVTRFSKGNRPVETLKDVYGDQV